MIITIQDAQSFFKVGSLYQVGYNSGHFTSGQIFLVDEVTDDDLHYSYIPYLLSNHHIYSFSHIFRENERSIELTEIARQI